MKAVLVRLGFPLSKRAKIEFKWSKSEISTVWESSHQCSFNGNKDELYRLSITVIISWYLQIHYLLCFLGQIDLDLGCSGSPTFPFAFCRNFSGCQNSMTSCHIGSLLGGVYGGNFASGRSARFPVIWLLWFGHTGLDQSGVVPIWRERLVITTDRQQVRVWLNAKIGNKAEGDVSNLLKAIVWLESELHKTKVKAVFAMSHCSSRSRICYKEKEAAIAAASFKRLR